MTSSSEAGSTDTTRHTSRVVQPIIRSDRITDVRECVCVCVRERESVCASVREIKSARASDLGR